MISILDITLESKLHNDFKLLAFEKKVRIETEQRFLITNTLLKLKNPHAVLKEACQLLHDFYSNTKYISFIRDDSTNTFSVVSTCPTIDLKDLFKENCSLNIDPLQNDFDIRLKAIVKKIFNEESYFIKKIISHDNMSAALFVIVTNIDKTTPFFSALDEFLSLISGSFENAILYQKQLLYEKKLEQAHKMESLGILAGGVAHDLNNILSGLVGYPDLLLLDIDDKNPMRETLLIIKNSAEKASSIIDDLLLLARRGAIVMQPHDINQIVNKLITSHEFKNIFQNNKHVNLEITLENDLPEILCSKVHIEKSLLNIVINSIDALKDTKSGTIQITTKLQHLKVPFGDYISINKGDYVVIEISDTGNGIKEENLRRIFDPFFTTKKMGKISGTGLGLHIVWGVMKDHNGYIDLNSKIGLGTKIKLYFPIKQEISAKEKIKLR